MTLETSPHHRGNIEELDEQTSRERLRGVSTARVVHVVAGEPQIAVVNIGVDGDDVVVRCTKGSRLATALATPGAPVLIEADELDPATRSGWSVVARGRMTPVLEQVESARLDRTMPPSWILGDAGGTWLRLTVDEISGREVGGAVDRD